MELFVLYLWLKLNVLTSFFIGLGVISILISVGFLLRTVDLYGDIEKQHYWEKWKPSFKKFLYAIPFSFIIAGLIPSKTDVAILVGTHYALKATETPEAAKVMTLLRKKANEMLDQELNEPVKEKK